MHRYPQSVEIDNKLYNYEKILKDDFFSINVLYLCDEDGSRYVLKHSDFRFILGKLLRPVAMLMSWREYQIYKAVEDIEGVPPLGPRYGKRGYFHKFIEGRTLHEIDNGKEIPQGFFDELRTILDQIHGRRIFYLDLNKRGNIILGDDMKPWLIDYQICIPFPKATGGIFTPLDKLFNLLIGEDIYHIYKHKRAYHEHDMRPEEFQLAQKSKFNQLYDKFLGTPYRKVKRLIYPSGSNEVIWYKWKHMDQTRKTS